MAALRRVAAPPAAPRPALLARAVGRLARRVARPLAPLLRDLLEFALPQRCPGCGLPAPAERLLCEPCHARLPRLEAAVCARCLLEDREPDRCQRHPHDQVHAAWVYDERVASLVHAFKFGGRPGLARVLAPALAAVLPASTHATRLVTAVPLHAARRRERGYDQAAVLAEALATQLEVPFVPGVLERARATRAQSALGPQARRRNVSGAFRLAHAEWVRGCEVIVVDDVVTTGATLHEAMRAVRRSGASTRGSALAWAQ